MTMMFVEDVIDRRDHKAREIDRQKRRSAKQIYRAAQEAIRADKEEGWRNARSTKHHFAMI